MTNDRRPNETKIPDSSFKADSGHDCSCLHGRRATWATSRLLRPRVRAILPGVEHRHLNHQGYTLAAIDDVIARGGRSDWIALRRAAAADPAVMRRILKVCAAYELEPYAQRHHLWRQYAARRVA